jgi:predicted phosphodiesterase
MTQSSTEDPIVVHRPTAFITADWHVTEHVWKYRRTLERDTRRGLEQIERETLDKSMAVVIAGDIFHRKTPSRQDMWLLHKFTQKFYYILGNHDAEAVEAGKDSYSFSDSGELTQLTYPDLVANSSATLSLADRQMTVNAPKKVDANSWYYWEPYKEWNDLVEEIYLREGNSADPWFPYARGNLCFTGINYQPTHEAFDKAVHKAFDGTLMPTVPGSPFNVLVAHQNCSKFTPQASPELVDGMLPDGHLLVICGHSHTPKVSTIASVSGKPIPILSPGSLFPCSIDDTSEKYLYLLCRDGYMLRRKLAHREIHTWDMTECQTIDECTVFLRKQLQALMERGGVPFDTVRDNAIHIKYPVKFQDWINNIPKSLIQAVNDNWVRGKIIPESVFFSAVHPNNVVVPDMDLDTPISLATDFDYVRTVFNSMELDPVVREMVETMLTREQNQETYNQLKTLC